MGRYQDTDRLYSFAVVADTHLNQTETESDSPFEINRRANRRLRHVINDMNQRDLAHVVHLGDVVHPVPSNPELYKGAATQFFNQVAKLQHPLYIVPGNHDVGDKNISWGPAGTVQQSYLDAWSEYFGDHYFHFSVQDVHFIGLNIQLYGSGLPMESTQRKWLADILEQCKGERIMLFSHYPPYLLDPKEQEHYDNLGDTSRQEILDLIKTWSIEALFAGHVHHFWYNSYEECHFYLLPSTAFTRQDYSEMFRTSPADDAFGRNDWSKLGYMIVHVYEQGHQFEIVRCNGKELKNYPNKSVRVRRISSVNPNTNRFPVMGFDLRHDWCETVQIPPLGGLDEFDRKWVRNDYALLAVWEMGAKHLRIPASDLRDEVRRQRLKDLTNLGFAFTLFSSASEAFNILPLVEANSPLICDWEISGHLEELLAVAAKLSPLTRRHDISLYLSLLRSKADILKTKKTYYHVINHGFSASDTSTDILMTLESATSVFDGVVFRCGFYDSIEETIDNAMSVRTCTGLKTSIHLRLSADNPAQFQHDDALLCNRLARTMCYSWYRGFNQIYCDTFTDNERGYFPRIGVLDRTYNPRNGFNIVKCLHSLFNTLGKVKSWNSTTHSEAVDVVSIVAKHGEFTMFLFQPNSNVDLKELAKISKGTWVNWRDAELVDQAPQVNGLPLARIRVFDRE